MSKFPWQFDTRTREVSGENGVICEVHPHAMGELPLLLAAPVLYERLCQLLSKEEVDSLLPKLTKEVKPPSNPEVPLPPADATKRLREPRHPEGMYNGYITPDGFIPSKKFSHWRNLEKRVIVNGLPQLNGEAVMTNGVLTLVQLADGSLVEVHAEEDKEVSKSKSKAKAKTSLSEELLALVKGGL